MNNTQDQELIYINFKEYLSWVKSLNIDDRVIFARDKTTIYKVRHKTKKYLQLIISSSKGGYVSFNNYLNENNNLIMPTVCVSLATGQRLGYYGIENRHQGWYLSCPRQTQIKQSVSHIPFHPDYAVLGGEVFITSTVDLSANAIYGKIINILVYSNIKYFVILFEKEKQPVIKLINTIGKSIGPVDYTIELCVRKFTKYSRIDGITGIPNTKFFTRKEEALVNSSTKTNEVLGTLTYFQPVIKE